MASGFVAARWPVRPSRAARQPFETALARHLQKELGEPGIVFNDQNHPISRLEVFAIIIKLNRQCACNPGMPGERPTSGAIMMVSWAAGSAPGAWRALTGT